MFALFRNILYIYQHSFLLRLDYFNHSTEGLRPQEAVRPPKEEKQQQSIRTKIDWNGHPRGDLGEAPVARPPAQAAEVNPRNQKKRSFFFPLFFMSKCTFGGRLFSEKLLLHRPVDNLLAACCQRVTHRSIFFQANLYYVDKHQLPGLPKRPCLFVGIVILRFLQRQ